MKICWLFIEKSVRYLCWTHIIRLGEPCKEKKKRKIQFDFSFFSFFRCVWTQQRFHLICCWKRLNLCSFFTLVLLCVREAVDVFLAEFFPSGQVPQHTQHNRLLYKFEKWTLSGWLLELIHHLSFKLYIHDTDTNDSQSPGSFSTGEGQAGTSYSFC